MTIRTGILALAFLPIGPAEATQQKAEDPGAILDTHLRTAEDARRIYAGMKRVEYVPPPGRWELLPRTHRLLQNGGELRIVMLGDSIVHDAANSSWDLLLSRDYPRARVHRTASLRGTTGCWWFKEPSRLKRFVFDQRPDLVMIGGISHREDADSVREVVRQIREGAGADILLMTGPFGFVDPRDDAQWRKVTDPPAGDFRRKLPEIAKEFKTGYLDMQLAWGEYVRASGLPVERFKRDKVHANPEGEQILGRILLRYFAPQV
jgi:lysophospholipase L1-like esterase